MIKLLAIIVNYIPILLNIILWKCYILMAYIIKYRSAVIDQNLTNSFGSTLQPIQIKDIKKSFYKNLIRYLGEIMYVVAWPKEKLTSSITVVDKDKWDKYFTSHKSIIVTASHYGNWEMNIVLLPALLQRKVIGFYKPMSNATMDNIMVGIRAKFGLELHPIDQTARIMHQRKGEDIIYIFIADQTPLNMNGVYWNTFLGQRTPWLNGPEKLAKKFDYPVLYLDQIPADYTTSKQFYTLDIKEISATPRQNDEGQITEKYSQLLEKEILSNPSFWLWSHKRWKRAVPPTT